jgi:hypothetical protein
LIGNVKKRFSLQFKIELILSIELIIWKGSQKEEYNWVLINLQSNERSKARIDGYATVLEKQE